MPTVIVPLSDSITSDSSFNIDGVTHRGFELEHDADGRTYAFRFQGDREAMRALVDAHSVNEVHVNYGKLKNIRLVQDAGPLWYAEFRFENDKITSDTEPPDTDYGVKSCRLQGGMLAEELCNQPNYRMCWDHWLFAAAGTTTVPSWWASMTVNTIPAADKDKYVWSKGETPPPAKESWTILKNPTKAGVRSWDMATYNIVESARFKTPTAAGTMVKNRLNKIGAPATTFGITGGTWKCERAEVAWNGKYWLATLEWVRSVDESGWDADLYDNVSSSN